MSEFRSLTVYLQLLLGKRIICNVKPIHIMCSHCTVVLLSYNLRSHTLSVENEKAEVHFFTMKNLSLHSCIFRSIIRKTSALTLTLKHTCSQSGSVHILIFSHKVTSPNKQAKLENKIWPHSWILTAISCQHVCCNRRRHVYSATAW